jgi:signal transduction histidine kinase
MKYTDRIFKPFQRLHGKGEYEGTGMGLAICDKIVRLHGGRIVATSVPGAGSLFVIDLPADIVIDERVTRQAVS